MSHVVFIAVKEFYIQAIFCSNVSLLNAPLAIIKDRLVLDVSREAARWGVCTGIAKSLARRRCPDLICEDYNPDLYAETFTRVWTEFARRTPQVEPVEMHEGFLDLTGCFPRTMKIEEFMSAMLWRLRFETGLEATWGGGQDKWIARLASERNEWITPQAETAFLNRVSLQQLGLDGTLCERLQRYGILTVGSLFRTPRAFLQSHLQLTTKELQPLFQRDSSPVRALFPPPLLKAEAGIQWSTNEEITRAIHELSEEAARQLSECHQQSGQIIIQVSTRASEHACELKLAKPARKSASFEAILHRLIAEEQPRDLRKITLTLKRLSPAPQTQGALWENTSSKTGMSERIENVRLNLEKKYGHQTVQNGSDYASRVPPRFAQLIYEQRGIYLP